jgi:hypothetical protein
MGKHWLFTFYQCSGTVSYICNRSDFTSNIPQIFCSDQDIVVPPSPWEHPRKTRFLNPNIRNNQTNLMFFAGPSLNKGTEMEPW